MAYERDLHLLHTPFIYFLHYRYPISHALSQWILPQRHIEHHHQRKAKRHTYCSYIRVATLL